VTIRDVTVEVTSGSAIGIFVQSGGSLSLDRATVSGGAGGITALNGGSTVDISNTLVYGTTKAGIDLGAGSVVGGSISFVTIADTGASSTTFAGLVCPTSVFPVRSTIVWTPGSG